MFVAGEYGKPFRLNAGIDLSAATGFTLTVTHPHDAAQSFATQAGEVTLGTSDVQAEVERADGSVVTKTFLANEYVIYVTAEGDFDDEGFYKVQLQADFGAGKRLKSCTRTLHVHD